MDRRSLILGIGIGAIAVSTIIGITYIAWMANTNYSLEYTDEAIIRRAKELGLIERPSESFIEPALDDEPNTIDDLPEPEDIIEALPEPEVNLIEPDLLPPIPEPEPVTPQQVPQIETNVQPLQIEDAGDDTAISQSKTVITITKGMSSFTISDILEENGVIDDAVEFQQYLNEKGVTRVLLSGEYQFELGSDYHTILEMIVPG